MKRMTFGEAESIKPNKSVQAVLFDGELVGWLYSSYKNLLSPIEEVFWSINLTKQTKYHQRMMNQKMSGFIK